MNPVFAGNEAGVCTHRTPAAGAKQRSLRPAHPCTLAPRCTPAQLRGEAELFCISTSSVVADVAAHYAFRAHPCAAASTEPPAGCPVACNICAGVFRFRLWRLNNEANWENSYKSFFAVVIKEKGTHDCDRRYYTVANSMFIWVYIFNSGCSWILFQTFIKNEAAQIQISASIRPIMFWNWN